MDPIDRCNCMVKWGEDGDWMPAIAMPDGSFADPNWLKIAKPDEARSMLPDAIRAYLKDNGQVFIGKLLCGGPPFA